MTDRAAALAALRPSRSSTLPPPPTLAPPPADEPKRQPVSGRPEQEIRPEQGATGESTPVEDASIATRTGADPQPTDQPTTRSAGGRRGGNSGSATTSGGAASSSRRTRFEELVANPVDTCRTMGMVREGQPSKPLNVDLTPDVARSFDDRCRALRVKKKDVVELLLRAWLDEPNG